MDKDRTEMICKNCIFYKSKIENSCYQNEGECHLNPPIPHYRASNSWPSVNETDYCSKFANDIEIHYGGITSFVNTTETFPNQIETKTKKQDESNQNQKKS